MQHEKRIILVTENNLQAHSFSATLAELLQRPIQNVAHPNELLPEINRDQLFLVDLDYLRNQPANGWHAALTCNKQAPETVLLNAPNTADQGLLLLWPHTRGLFYRHDPLERLIEGLRKILVGELWLSRHLLSHLLSHYRQEKGVPQHPNIILTNREQQILQKLMTGASNMEIADSLFLSEHTVKTHLYNVFKKLNVKNRTQAVTWAKEYLGSPLESE